MPNCLECKHHRISPKDLALLRMSADPNIKIRYKCNITHPRIRYYTREAILTGNCHRYNPLEKPLNE